MWVKNPYIKKCTLVPSHRPEPSGLDINTGVLCSVAGRRQFFAAERLERRLEGHIRASLVEHLAEKVTNLVVTDAQVASV